jgi:hypothetical protein
LPTLKVNKLAPAKFKSGASFYCKQSPQTDQRLYPNAVFDTAIWTDEVLEKRTKSYGLSMKKYKTNNVLKTEVSSFNLAELAASLCGRAFAKTTGAQVPIDGGNIRVI